MFATKVFMFLAMIYGLASPSVAGHLSKAKRTHKVLDIIHRLLNVAGHERSFFHDHFVAFDALLPSSFTGRKTADVIPFNTINVNLGGAYRNGVFTCPLQGVYEFIWTTICKVSGNCDTGLYVNGSIKRRSYNYERTGRQYQQATKSVIIHLKKDDKVWIGIFSGHTTLSDGSYKSCLQGKLLQVK